MFFDLYLLRPDDASDDAMLIGEECSAEHAHYRLAIHFLLAIHAESLNKTLLSVANSLKWHRRYDAIASPLRCNRVAITV